MMEERDDFSYLNSAEDEYYKKFINVYKTDDEYSQYVKARIPEIESTIKQEK